MITQEIPISLLMDPQKMLIFRKGDYGNQIKIKFPDLTGITSAEFRFIKPDDTFVVSTGEIIENDIIITITQQMSLLSGCAIFNLRLINSQSNIYTYVGRALIDDNINLDDYAASVAEVNGLVFPDDFLTSEDLSQYATKSYVNEAIAEVPTYTPPDYSTTPHKTGRKWIDGKDIWEVTLQIEQANHYISFADLGIGSYLTVDGLILADNDVVLPLYDYVNSTYRTYLNIDRVNKQLSISIYGWTFESANITLTYTKED
jgi:hypothetical protein